MENKKRVAVLGGSFNPPTIGHIILATSIYNEIENIDEVWIEPCGDSRPDKDVFVPCQLRYEMCKTIVEDLVPEGVPVKVDDHELTGKKYYPTYFLLKELTEKYPNCEFIFVAGADVFDTFNEWDEFEKLLDEFEFIVIPRDGKNLDGCKYKPKKYQYLQVRIDVSSTLIRQRVKGIKDKVNWGLNGLTTPNVIRIIKNNNLYQ